MTQPFVFEGKRIRVLGIDENGYGPILGPLVVTGVLLEFEGDPFADMNLRWLRPPKGIADSKTVFSRSISSYSIGEIAALSLVALAYRTNIPKDFDELLKLVLADEGPLKNGFYRRIHRNYKLPLWAKFVDLKPLKEWLESAGILILSIKSLAAMPAFFNRKVNELGSKLALDFLMFWNLMQNTEFDVALCGKLGGTVNYRRFFEMVSEEVEVLEKRKEVSTYRLKESGRIVSFVLNGDKLLLPIAMASIVGKYLREIFMLELNEIVGHKESLPWASGYRHDAHTKQLMEQLVEKFGKDSVVRIR